MGVKDLWPILVPVQKHRKIAELKGKLIAVDLSVWVVQAKRCEALKKCNKPHLRNLFFRVSHLLKNGIQLVFVTEGEVPLLKQNTVRKRLESQGVVSKHDSDIGFSRKTFQRILNECQELLYYMGVPCVKSSGEAESFCAFLNLAGIVDGCITEDNDVFLYGARTVYRAFTICKEDPHVLEFTMDDIESKLHLNRQKLIALALLLGCDYFHGIEGVGVKSSVKFLKEMKNTDVLKRFKEWRELSQAELFPSCDFNQKKNVTHCDRCHHPGTRNQHNKNGCSACNSDLTCYFQNNKTSCMCDWHKNYTELEKVENEVKIYNKVKSKNNFPDQNVIDEYYKQHKDVPDKKDLMWSMPKLEHSQGKVAEWLSSVKESKEKLMCLITYWQIAQLCNNSSFDCSKFIFQPVRILRTKQIKSENYYLVIWEKIVGDQKTTHENPEYQDSFERAYPDVIKEFQFRMKLDAAKKEEQKKEKRRMKAKSKRHRKNINTTPRPEEKISHFFPIKKSLKHRLNSCHIDKAKGTASANDEPLEKKAFFGKSLHHEEIYID